MASVVAAKVAAALALAATAAVLRADTAVIQVGVEGKLVQRQVREVGSVGVATME